MAKKKARPNLLAALSGATVPKAKKVPKKAAQQKDKEEMRQLSLMVPHALWQRLQGEHNHRVQSLGPGEKRPQLRELVWDLLDKALPKK